MAVVPAAKIKEICTADETKLIRASRRPELSKLSAAELKKHAARARKLYDKWLAQSRGQSRARGKKVGFGESAANTQLKVQAFGDALEAFETQLARQAPAPVKKKAARKTKQTRSAGHRAARATIREELSAAQESLKEPARKAAKKKAVKRTAAKTVGDETPIDAAPKKKVPKRGRPASVPTAEKGSGLDKRRNRKATTAAKQARVDRSGLSSRVRGHVSGRGKRAQGRRDSRG